MIGSASMVASVNSIPKNEMTSLQKDGTFDNLIQSANSNNLSEEEIENLDGYGTVQIPSQDFNLQGITTMIDYELLHIGDNSNRRPLFILPGFSTSSVTMTIGRINRFKDDIFSQGFTDIYIFNFTSIGKLPQNIQKTHERPQYETYHQISKHLSEYLNRYDNISLLGRSAGGGLALQLVFFGYLERSKLVGLNIACPGYDIRDIENAIHKYPHKDLPVKLCWATDDQKIVEGEDNPDGGYALNRIFVGNGYKQFEYIQVIIGDRDLEGKDKHIHTHRIQPELIENLV